GNTCCETPDPIGIDYFPPTVAGDCEAGFCIQNTSLDPDKYCATWDFGDGTIVNHPVNVCPVHTYECDGEYVVCVTVYCCEDPNIATTVCIDIVVDCGRTCCETPDPFEIEHFPIQGGDICGAGFCLISPTLDPSKYCSSWDFGDGTVLDFPVDVCPEHIYDCDGIYNVCVTVYCCDDPSINLTQCITIEVDCPCHLPDASVVVTNINTADECYVVVDVVTAAGDCPEDLCYSVDFGDGSPIYTGPLPVNHTYATNGSYVACVHMYCCDEPSVGVLMCQDVLVDCYTPCDVSAYFGCSENGHTVVFNDLSSAGAGTVITNWFWDFGDGNTSNLQNPTHTYLADGVYLVCLTVTGMTADGDICEDTFCVEKEIICPKPCEIYPIFLTQDLDGCTVQFLDFTYIGAYTTANGVLWDFGDGNTSTNPNPIHTFPGSGTYTVCLTVYGSSPEGDCEETFCWDVTTDCDLPCEVDADFIWDMDQCNIYFVNTSTSSSPGTTVYQWNFGDGSTGFGDNPIHTYTMSGTYIVCLTAITTMPDGTVCTDEICQTISVDCPSPCEGDPYFEWTYDNCQVQFIDLSGAPVGNNIVAWYWDFGDGSTSSLQNPLHSYTSQGSYVVCLTILVSNGNELCEFTFCRDIYVQCPTGDPCEIQAKIKGEIIGECTYQFYDASVAGAGTSIIGWHWDFGDGTTSNLQNPIHTFSGSGWRTICLTVTATNGLVECSDTRCFTKYFECPCSCESIVPTFNITMGPNCEVYLEDTTVYPDCVDLEHIKWKFGDGHGDSGTQSIGHVYNGPGLYNICMLIITTDGNQHCERLVCQDVYINCQGIADDQSKDLGDEFDANVYPNPSDGNFTISTTGENLNRIVVRDLSGRTVEDITNLSKANVQIDLNKEERGVYLIELFSGEQSVVKRVIIQ
ncbi:MAG: PKD domain-containing protein, partial [Flavobacteriales bacterium]